MEIEWQSKIAIVATKCHGTHGTVIRLALTFCATRGCINLALDDA